MPDIPVRRRILESLLVQAMLEAEGGCAAAAADYSTAVLLMLDGRRDRELADLAAGVLRRAGVADEPTFRFD